MSKNFLMTNTLTHFATASGAKKFFYNFDTDSMIGNVYLKSCHTFTVPVFATAGQTDTVDLKFIGNKSQSQAKYSSQVTFFTARRIFAEFLAIILTKGVTLSRKR
jgi:hypothetical protein